MSNINTAPQGPQVPEVVVTAFRSVKTNRPLGEKTEPWPEFAEAITTKRLILAGKHEAPLISHAKFNGSRANDNVESVTAAVMDFDSGQPFEEVAARADKWTFAAYSTHSHSEAKPTFRMHLPLSRPVTADEWPIIWQGLNTELGGQADQSAKDAARISYWPSCPAATADIAFSVNHDGAPVDVDRLLAEHGAAAAPRLAVPNAARAGKAADEFAVQPAPEPETPQGVAKLKSALAVLDADMPYGQWFKVVSAVLAHGWPVCDEIAEDWTRSARADHGRLHDDLPAKFNTMRPRPGGVGPGTLYHMAAEKGWSPAVVGTIVAPVSTSAVGINGGPEPGPADHPLSARARELAALPTIEYELRRRDEAKALGIRTAALDEAVEALRPAAAAKPGSGRALSLKSPVPWAEPVDGADLLDQLAGAFRRFVVLPEGAAEALALWTLAAYNFELFPITPRLAVVSPEMRCGKSSLLRLLKALVPKALGVENITAPALFRTIELARPTLIIDEADTFLAENPELRGIINSGHARDGQVVRLVPVGDDFEPRSFSTWCPLAIAAIGKLPPTILDRSVVIAMRRKTAAERVATFRADRAGDITILAQKAARWSLDHAEQLRGADPALPEDLGGDRQRDNWRCLMALADCAGGAWPDKARSAARVLGGEVAKDEPTAKVQLARGPPGFVPRAGCGPPDQPGNRLHPRQRRDEAVGELGQGAPLQGSPCRPTAQAVRGHAAQHESRHWNSCQRLPLG